MHARVTGRGTFERGAAHRREEAVVGNGGCRVPHAVKVHDVVIADVRSGSSVCQSGDSGDRVFIHLVRRGTWRFAVTDELREAVVVPAGSFIASYTDPPVPIDADRGAAATVLILPGRVLDPLLGGRRTVGPARSAEARVLMAHADTVGRTADGLSPAGARGARDALIELARGVLRQELGDAGSRTAHSLVRAATQIADAHLTDPGLSPSSLARDLNVSVRTLHRSFAKAGEPVAAYIRRSRLERARAELAASADRPDIAEVAARWCFADNSHFTRVFRKQYGETPSQFARVDAMAKS
jgi:AraC-like DNA-binding protein